MKSDNSINELGQYAHWLETVKSVGGKFNHSKNKATVELGPFIIDLEFSQNEPKVHLTMQQADSLSYHSAETLREVLIAIKDLGSIMRNQSG